MPLLGGIVLSHNLKSLIMRTTYLSFLLTLLMFSCGESDDAVQEPINEPPVIADYTVNVGEFPFMDMQLASLEATDPENDNLTYQLTNQIPEGVLELDGTNVKVANNQLYDIELYSELTADIEVSDGVNTSSAKITVNLNQIPFPNRGLMAYYPLGTDEASDKGPLGRNGIVNGTLTTITDRMNVSEGASLFNNSSVEIQAFAELEKNITISAWVYANPGSTVFNSIVSRTQQITGTTSGNRNYVLRLETDKTINAHKTTTDATTYQEIESTNTVPIHDWTHVVLKIENGKTWTIYKDGVYQNSETFEDDIELNTDTSIFIGCLISGKEFFSGAIDDVRFYNRALKDSEIIVLANDNF